jgi:light-harvesting complex 1 beta chain
MTEPPVSRPTAPSYSAYAEPAARPPTLSGLTEDEAKSFHSAFVGSFIAFTLVAAVAHFLVWQWRPWIPGVAGYETRTAQVSPAPATPAASAPAIAIR